MDLRTYLKKAGHGASRRMAQALGAYESDISNWAAGRRKPGVAVCVAIELHTNGAVTRRDLRPDDWQDIWPELDGAQALADAQIQPQAPASQALAATENVAVEVAHG